MAVCSECCEVAISVVKGDGQYQPSMQNFVLTDYNPVLTWFVFLFDRGCCRVGADFGAW